MTTCLSLLPVGLFFLHSNPLCARRRTSPPPLPQLSAAASALAPIYYRPRSSRNMGQLLPNHPSVEAFRTLATLPSGFPAVYRRLNLCMNTVHDWHTCCEVNLEIWGGMGLRDVVWEMFIPPYMRRPPSTRPTTIYVTCTNHHQHHSTRCLITGIIRFRWEATKIRTFVSPEC
jgi:hypothetical protein